MLQVIRKRLSKKAFYREKGLKGKVKSIVTFADEAKTIPLLSVKFNENGDITERIIILSGQKEEMIYDHYGIISEWNIYDMEGVKVLQPDNLRQTIKNEITKMLRYLDK